MNSEVYDKYTSTQVLHENTPLDWQVKYFNRLILPHIPKDKNLKILDIGCGTGGFLYALDKSGYKNCSGIDISKEQTEYAKKVLNLPNVITGDALFFLKGETQKINVILLIDVLEHLEIDYAIELLKKIHSTLFENGILILRVPNALSPLNPLISSDITHKKVYTYKSIEQILRLGGFNNFEHYPLLPFIHGVKSFFRFVLYKTIIQPIIKSYLLIQHGNTEGGIYTTNIMTVVRK